MTVEEIADFYNVPKKMLSAKDNSFTFNQNSMSIPTREEFIKLTDQIKADQALRDAAPDLLEACKHMLNLFTGGFIGCVAPEDFVEEIELLKAAISKANEII